VAPLLEGVTEVTLCIESFRERPSSCCCCIGGVESSVLVVGVGMSRLLVTELVLRLECARRRGATGGGMKGCATLAVPGEGASDVILYVDDCLGFGGRGPSCLGGSSAAVADDASGSLVAGLGRRVGGGGGRGAAGNVLSRLVDAGKMLG
jgi:hypothetical protein